MSDQHLDGITCPCEPKVSKVLTRAGYDVMLHKPFTMNVKLKRRKIWGLPQGWVIVGNKNGAVITQAERNRELEAFKGAESMKAKRRRERDRDAYRD